MGSKGPLKSKVPILDGSNYQFWKARVRTFIKSIDERAWQCVLKEWTQPTKPSSDETTTVVKPISE